MLRSITAKQFLELETYKRLNPFKELRSDYRIASIVQMLANVNRGKDQRVFSLEECVLKFGEEEEVIEQQDHAAFFRALAGMYATPMENIES